VRRRGRVAASHPRVVTAVVEPDTRPAFTLDPGKPFVVEFGRGSGWHGLDVVRVDESGSVELQRLTGNGGIEAATMRLSRARVAAVADLVNAAGLTGMGRSYAEPGVHDGTQWVLWVSQPPADKAVYFDNTFPSAITRFAGRLDAVLDAAGRAGVTWTQLPVPEGVARQKALWDRLDSAR
jgi:hypothetical protein